MKMNSQILDGVPETKLLDVDAAGEIIILWKNRKFLYVKYWSKLFSVYWCLVYTQVILVI